MSRASVNEPLVTTGRPVSRTDYGDEGNRKAAQLRTMPPERFTFDRALLRDVLRFLAEAAGIPFVGIPDSSPQAQQLVTFRMSASPFAALESVARQNEVKLVYEDGVWFMRVGGASSYAGVRELENANELTGVIYQLRHDPADRVDFMGQLIGPAAQRAENQQNTASSAGGSVTASTPNIPLQNSQKVFVQRAPKLVNDVRAILGLRPLVYNEDGSIKDEDIVGGTDIPSQAQAALQSASAAGQTNATPGPANSTTDYTVRGEAANRLIDVLGSESRRQLGISPVYVPAARPQVIYNSDSNFLWVVATRKQHKWVAEYLTKVDQPQELIAIEVKFLETKKNPQYDFGINWSKTFGGDGLQITGSARAGVGGEYGFGFDREKGWGSTNFSSSGGGNSILSAISNAVINNRTNITVQQILNDAAVNNLNAGSFSTNFSGSGSSTRNLDFRGQNTTIPYEAVLSTSEFSFALQAYMADRDTSIVQYPRVLTLNNKEVAITAAENTPLNVGTQLAGEGGGLGNPTVAGLGYLPTGTQINILPKVVDNNQISMTVAITVSSVIGETILNLGTGPNLYPITSERVYNASLQVDSGYTLAVGGLEKVADSNEQGGIPFLKDVPGLGYFFKNTNKKRDKVNLIIFITPYLIGDPAKTAGISVTPQSIVPQRPGGIPQAPTFTTDGKLSGGDPAVADAFAWLEFQLRYFRQVNIESLMTLDSIQKLRDVISVARALLSDLQSSAGQPPYDPETQAGRNAIRAEELLVDLNRTLAGAQENLM